MESDEPRRAAVVAETYMDEFAEWHAKDLVVRDSLAGAVPSAAMSGAGIRTARI